MGEKRYYPAFLDLVGRLVVVVGSGRNAERKARQLSRYKANVLVITPQPSPQLVAAQADGDLDIEARDYVRGDLEGAALVICTSSDPEIQKAVFEESTRVGCLVSIAGAPDLSSFLVPSAVHREPLQIALSTGGVAPQLAKHLRRRLDAEFGEEWATLAKILGGVRVLAMERFEDTQAADDLLEEIIGSDVLEQIRSGATLSPVSVFERFAPIAESDQPEDSRDNPPLR